MSEVWEMVRTAIAGLAMIVSAAAFVFARRDRSSEAQKAAISSLRADLSARMQGHEEHDESRHGDDSKRLNQIEARLAGLDETVRHIPDQRDFDALQKNIGSVGAAVARVEGEMSGINRQLTLIQEHLLSKS